MESAVQASQSRLEAFTEESERWVHLHQRASASVTGPQLTAWTAEVTRAATADGNPIAACSAVRTFLENAGQVALKEDLEAAEAAFCVGVDKLRTNLLASLQLLNHYFAVSSLYPRSYRQRHRSNLYARWARELVEDFSVTKCHQVRVRIGHSIACASCRPHSLSRCF